MKTIIFSDTHLTDQFDPELYKALENMIQEADQVIINGDFWDGYSFKVE
jgi:predicted phosphodiesterase